MNLKPLHKYFIAVLITALLFGMDCTPNAFADKPENPGKSDDSNRKDKDKDKDDGVEDDDSTEGEEDSNVTNVKVVLKLEQSLSGELEFEVDVKYLELGEYDLYISGGKKGSFTVKAEGNHTRGRIRFDTKPNRSDELLLDFDIRGEVVEIYKGEAKLFSGVAPEVAEQDGDIEFDDASDGVKISAIPAEVAPENASMTIKLDKEQDGSLELKIEFLGLDTGVYGVWIDDVLQANVQIIDSDKRQFIKFVNFPENDNEYLLNFDVVGKNIDLRQEAIILFSSIINVPLNSPIIVEHEASDYESIKIRLFPDSNAQILSDDRKYTDWFGYYDDSGFPILQHCVLGQLEYRYDEIRNLLVSNTYGVLEILKSTIDGSVVYYSFETGQYLAVSTTTESCDVLEPGAIFDSEGQEYQGSVLPEADDVEGYYDLAFKATQKTQVRSAQVIQMVQAKNYKEAANKLLDAEFHRNLAVHNANKVIQAAQLKNEAVDFWTQAAQHLIETSDLALLEAQTVYSAIQ